MEIRQANAPCAYVRVIQGRAPGMSGLVKECSSGLTNLEKVCVPGSTRRNTFSGRQDRKEITRERHPRNRREEKMATRLGAIQRKRGKKDDDESACRLNTYLDQLPHTTLRTPPGYRRARRPPSNIRHRSASVLVRMSRPPHAGTIALLTQLQSEWN